MWNKFREWWFNRDLGDIFWAMLAVYWIGAIGFILWVIWLIYTKSETPFLTLCFPFVLWAFIYSLVFDADNWDEPINIFLRIIIYLFKLCSLAGFGLYIYFWYFA